MRGAFPIFADIDYWSGCLVPEKAEAKISEKTKAVVVGNVNGHPAPWTNFRDIATRNNLILIVRCCYFNFRILVFLFLFETVIRN